MTILKGLAAGLIGLFVIASSTVARAEVVSVYGSGVEAWMQADPAVPVAALSFHIEGGAATDPPALQGRARLFADLLNEGAGERDGLAFKKRLADLNASISFSATQDSITGTLYTLRENFVEAADLLGIALAAPRFDEKEVERARAAQIASLESARERPSRRAYRAFLETAFANHPYARSVRGRVATLKTCSAELLMKVFHSSG